MKNKANPHGGHTSPVITANCSVNTPMQSACSQDQELEFTKSGRPILRKVRIGGWILPITREYGQKSRVEAEYESRFSLTAPSMFA